MKNKKLTQQEYIEQCKKVNPEYDYSEIGFKNTRLFPNLVFEQEYTSEWLGKQRLDIYCPIYNFVIEYDGGATFFSNRLFWRKKLFQNFTTERY